MLVIIVIIQSISQLVTFVVIGKVLLSYFMSPVHPVRQAVDGFVEPVLAPIRRFMPQTGMIDFSPMVLIFLVQIITGLLVSLLRTI